MKRAAACGLLLAAWILACGSSGRDGFGGGPNGDGNGNSADGGGGPNDFGSTDASDDGALPPSIGTLTGKVVMPEGTIPLSDALVYLTSTQPPPIPTNAYCDKCVALDSYAFTYSKPDGTFELPAYQAGEQYIVVQKGQFRRVRRIAVNPGTQAVPGDLTRLPGKTDAALGDTTPRMLIWPGQWDHVEKSLKKIGLQDFERFQPPPLDFNAYSQKMKEFPNYHIVFLPCAGGVNEPGSGPMCSVTVDPKLKNAAKEFVALGGKLYVSDWSYEYVRQGWPGAIKWVGETSQLGSACSGGGDYAAEFDDVPLREWMTAIGEGNAQLKAAWTAIEKVSPIQSIDENGNAFTQTPKVWASAKLGAAGTRPATVSFQDRCGRVLYSTYHAEGSDTAGGQGDFLAQEKALMHILLEVGVCVGPKPVPPVK